ncbi:OX-2 membrane glycoprotein isoform X2 [Notolabrus celidotus]|nr:OX-2 membrane glycoprotein isoform X2 [Notolabrus celidotus]
MSQITKHGNRTAVYGKDAYYSCAVDNLTGVLQVTWQRLFKDSIENLATYSNRFGQLVNTPYLEKVVFTEASLNSTSITVKNVTWDDDGCYICSFNAYPDGSQRKQICLTVQGISEVKTAVHPPSSAQEEQEEVEVVISCSATGKPAPTIQWASPPDATRLDQVKTATVENSDRTFTSSSNVTLQVPSDWSGYVDCVLNEGVRGQRHERIPLIVGDGDVKKKENEVNGRSKVVVAIVVFTTVVFVLAIVAVALRHQRLKNIRRNHSVV